MTCLEEVCAGVADDCDATVRHDDSTSEGQLRWRRCRNLVKKIVDAGSVEGLEDAVADVSDNALQIRVSGSAVSFYSSRNGTEHPDLGGSKTKKAIVSEMQMQLDGVGAPDQPARLVVLYEADRDGLAAAAVGTLKTPTDWAWRFNAYTRSGLGVFDMDVLTSGARAAYESEPEPELPPLEVVEDQEAQLTDED